MGKLTINGHFHKLFVCLPEGTVWEITQCISALPKQCLTPPRLEWQQHLHRLPISVNNPHVMKLHQCEHSQTCNLVS